MPLLPVQVLSSLLQHEQGHRIVHEGAADAARSVSRITQGRNPSKAHRAAAAAVLDWSTSWCRYEHSLASAPFSAGKKTASSQDFHANSFQTAPGLCLLAAAVLRPAPCQYLANRSWARLCLAFGKLTVRRE